MTDYTNNGQRIWKELISLSDRLDITIRFKTSSWFMKSLSVIMYFVQGFKTDFMTRYTTTVGNTVYFPNEEHISDKNRASKILAHEIVHVSDLETLGTIRFGWMYYFPQLLALIAPFSLLELVIPGYNIWLLAFFLICAGPWPSPGRVTLELRGYALSIACRHWSNPYLKDDTVWRQEMFSEYYDTFTQWGYWRMSWDREYIDIALEKIIRLILEDKLGEMIPISDEIKQIYKDESQ